MLDLSKYQSIGAALKDALEEFSNEVCLIEADREREKERLTYRDFKDARAPSREGVAGRGLRRGRSSQHHHDESVQVADFAPTRFFTLAAFWFRSITNSRQTSSGNCSSIPAQKS